MQCVETSCIPAEHSNCLFHMDPRKSSDSKQVLFQARVQLCRNVSFITSGRSLWNKHWFMRPTEAQNSRAGCEQSHLFCLLGTQMSVWDSLGLIPGEKHQALSLVPSFSLKNHGKTDGTLLPGQDGNENRAPMLPLVTPAPRNWGKKVTVSPRPPWASQ